MPPAIGSIIAVAGKKDDPDDAFITTLRRFSPHVQLDLLLSKVDRRNRGLRKARRRQDYF
jgi:hypothetical protein